MDQAHKDRKAELEEQSKNGTLDENGKKELEGIKSYESSLEEDGSKNDNKTQAKETGKQDRQNAGVNKKTQV